MREQKGFTKQQWIMLAFSFIFGVISVFTIDKVFLSGTSASQTVRAAVTQP